jgi:hypothetical protein
MLGVTFGVSRAVSIAFWTNTSTAVSPCASRPIAAVIARSGRAIPRAIGNANRMPGKSAMAANHSCRDRVAASAAVVFTKPGPGPRAAAAFR